LESGFAVRHKKKTLTRLSSSLTACSLFPLPFPMAPLGPSRIRAINLIETLKEERRERRGHKGEEEEEAPEEAVEW